MCVFHCPNIPLKTKAYTDLRIRSHLRTYYHFCYCELETIYRLGNASTTLYIRSYRYMYVKDWQLLIDIYFYFCPLSSFDSQKCQRDLFVMYVLIYPFAQSLYNGWSIRALQSSRIYTSCSIKNQDLRSNYKYAFLHPLIVPILSDVPERRLPQLLVESRSRVVEKSKKS